jgi:hypothetical protein
MLDSLILFWNSASHGGGLEEFIFWDVTPYNLVEVYR